MKFRLLHLLLIAATLPATAQNITIDKIEYELLESGMAAVYKAHDCYGDVPIPESITSDGKRYQVSEIYGDAFEECPAMTSIRIPKTITVIRSGAFNGCQNLREVHITDLTVWCNIDFRNNRYGYFEDSPFEYAQGLYLNNELITDLVIPDGVTQVNEVAFSRCKNLTSVTISGGVTTISQGAFQYCTGLTSVIMGEPVTTIEKDAFRECTALTSITIPPSVTSIDSFVFYGCSKLRDVHISDLTAWCKIKFDDNYANPLGSADNLYLGDELITDLIIPNNVNTIKYEAFSGFDGLRSLTVGNSVEHIASRVFWSCMNLTSVTIGSSIKGIGDNAFENCKRLKSIMCLSEKPCGLGREVFTNFDATLYVPSGSKAAYQNSDWSGFKNIVEFDPASRDEAYMAVVGGLEYSCDPLTGTAKVNRLLNGDGDVIIRESVTVNGETYKVTDIGENIFTDCCEMTSVSIPDSVTEIADNAFSGCVILTSASIGNSVERIGEKAFYGCYSLLKITLGKSVTSIGDYAFYINRLAEIYCLNNTPCRVGLNAFRNYNATLYVPVGSMELYTDDPEWGKFNDIREFEASGVGMTPTDVSQLSTDYYTLSGVKIATSSPGETPAGLPAGIYITRNGGKIAKTVIR